MARHVRGNWESSNETASKYVKRKASDFGRQVAQISFQRIQGRIGETFIACIANLEPTTCQYDNARMLAFYRCRSSKLAYWQYLEISEVAAVEWLLRTEGVNAVVQFMYGESSSAITSAMDRLRQLRQPFLDITRTPPKQAEPEPSMPEPTLRQLVVDGSIGDPTGEKNWKATLERPEARRRLKQAVMADGTTQVATYYYPNDQIVEIWEVRPDRHDVPKAKYFAMFAAGDGPPDFWDQCPDYLFAHTLLQTQRQTHTR